MKSNSSGFTIVELLIVIVVLAVLTAITVVAYNGIQTRANDTRILSAINQLDKGIRIYNSQTGLQPYSGASSTAAVNNGTCPGANAAGGFAGTGSPYACTLEDLLVSANIVPSGIVTGLPKNTYYSTPPNGRFSVMFYSCPGSPTAVLGRYALYWTLQNPSSADSNSINNTLTTCSHTTNIRDTFGMRAARLVQIDQ